MKTMEFMNTAVFKKYIPDCKDIFIEEDRMKSDVPFLVESCKRLQTSKQFSFDVVPIGQGKTIIEWYWHCWDDEFVLMYTLFQNIRKNIITDDDAKFSEIAGDLKEFAKDARFDVISATCDFIDCSWLRGKANDKLRALMKN